MIKFVVVLHRSPGTTPEQFRQYLETAHGPMAERMPGLRRYIRNFPVEDARRGRPKWDAVVELYWDDRESMEAAWSSKQGRATTTDLRLFTDLRKTSWSVVEEVLIRDERPVRV